MTTAARQRAKRPKDSHSWAQPAIPERCPQTPFICHDCCMAQQTSFPRQDIQVLLLEGISPRAVEAFRAAGYTRIEEHAKALPEDELKRRIAEAHIVGLRSRTQLTADVLAEARKLLAVGAFCIGTN